MSTLGESIKYFAHNTSLDAGLLKDLFNKVHSNNADISHITAFLTSLDLIQHDNIIYNELTDFLINNKFHESQTNDDILIFELNNKNLVKLLPGLLLLSFANYKVIITVQPSTHYNFAEMMQLSYIDNNKQLLEILSKFNFAMIEHSKLLAQKNFNQAMEQSTFGDKYKFLNLIAIPFTIKSIFLDYSVMRIPSKLNALKSSKIFTLDKERDTFMSKTCSFKDNIFEIDDHKNLFKAMLSEIDKLDTADLSESWIVRSAQNILYAVYNIPLKDSLNSFQQSFNNLSFSNYLANMREKLMTNGTYQSSP